MVGKEATVAQTSWRGRGGRRERKGDKGGKECEVVVDRISVVEEVCGNNAGPLAPGLGNGTIIKICSREVVVTTGMCGVERRSGLPRQRPGPSSSYYYLRITQSLRYLHFNRLEVSPLLSSLLNINFVQLDGWWTWLTSVLRAGLPAQRRRRRRLQRTSIRSSSLAAVSKPHP